MNKFKFSNGIWVWLVDDNFRNEQKLTNAPIPDEIPVATKNFDAMIMGVMVGEGGILEIPREVRIGNCGPKCSAAWPNKEHGACRGTGMFAHIVDKVPQIVDK
jgi:hypothetical protein